MTVGKFNQLSLTGHVNGKHQFSYDNTLRFQIVMVALFYRYTTYSTAHYITHCISLQDQKTDRQ